ncbi:GNAT family N-acetyltransferase [Viridibacterium curvum]|uniref:GNAT family N-acetyltransferase n=1 Tax=Viridibacterium curvum TaxID=1101404 RepID=A0ABP9QSH0_9RHOO
MAALLFLLDHYAAGPMGGSQPLTPETRARLVPGLRQRKDYCGFLAWQGDEAIGLINCFEGFSTFAAAPLLNVHDLVVLESRRGQGVGQLLLDAVEAAARQRRCCKLTLEVLTANRSAMALYQRAGFAPYVLDPAAGQALLMQKWLGD